MGYSGQVFTRPGVKNLIAEGKRPGALAWIERSAVQSIDAHCIQNWKIWRDVRGVSMAPTLANIRRFGVFPGAAFGSALVGL